jgi:hypothetical protein
MWDLCWTKWHWNGVSSEHFCFPFLILIFTYMLLLPEGQTNEAWEPSKKQWSFCRRDALDRELLSLPFNASVQKVSSRCADSVSVNSTDLSWTWNTYWGWYLRLSWRSTSELRSSVMWLRIVWCVGTDVSERNFLYIFKDRKSALKMDAASPPKRVHPSIKLRSVTFHIIIILLVWGYFENDVLTTAME